LNLRIGTTNSYAAFDALEAFLKSFHAHEIVDSILLGVQSAPQPESGQGLNLCKPAADCKGTGKRLKKEQITYFHSSSCDRSNAGHEQILSVVCDVSADAMAKGRAMTPVSCENLLI